MIEIMKMVANRIAYRKKKEEEEVRKYYLSEERYRSISQTRKEKRLSKMFQAENFQKTLFEKVKKNKEVNDFRITKSKRLNSIYNSVQ